MMQSADLPAHSVHECSSCFVVSFHPSHAAVCRVRLRKQSIYVVLFTWPPKNSLSQPLVFPWAGQSMPGIGFSRQFREVHMAEWSKASDSRPDPRSGRGFKPHCGHFWMLHMNPFFLIAAFISFCRPHRACSGTVVPRSRRNAQKRAGRLWFSRLVAAARWLPPSPPALHITLSCGTLCSAISPILLALSLQPLGAAAV